MDLDASDEQLDCPFLFASARDGYAVREIGDLVNNKKDMTPLFETIIDYIPAPEGDPDANTQVLISTIDYNEYVGRIGIGKVDNGCLKVNQEAVVVNHHEPDKQKKVRISKLYEFDGLNKVDVAEAKIGSIVAISGIADIHIGDTICAPENPVAIPFQKISEPTLSMNFMVNDSPLAGQEGKFITSRHLRDRLFRELNTDVSLRVEETESADCFKVSGRGELHLSVLIENMRREGYEFAVSKAEVIYKEDERGRKLEPMEIAYVDVPDEFSGTVIQLLSERKGELHGMSRASDGSTRLEFEIPARGLIGFRGIFMTSTKGMQQIVGERTHLFDRLDVIEARRRLAQRVGTLKVHKLVHQARRIDALARKQAHHIEQAGALGAQRLVVVLNEQAHVADQVVRKRQAIHDGARLLGPELGVTVKVAAARMVDRKAIGLGNVVQKRRPH